MKYTMQNGKTLLIVSGGSIDINFSKEYIKDKKYDRIIAADSGLAHCKEIGIEPTDILGDFDSLKNKELLEEYRKKVSLFVNSQQEKITQTPILQ
ncbi:hypothetical protein NIA73_04900 [Anaerobutyricum hallii]|nr:hypothetical protein [Anaerobutyricum hallii]